MPKSKILVSLTTFGRGWTLKNATADYGIHANAIGPSKKQNSRDEIGKAGYFQVFLRYF